MERKAAVENHITLPIRRLVEFLLRGGSIDNRFGGMESAQEGARIHRRIQKAAGDAYEAEVTLTLDREVGGIRYTLEGRADGVFTEETEIPGDSAGTEKQTVPLLYVDEIKTVAQPLEMIDENFNRTHWAQAMCYACILCIQRDLPSMGVRLTYARREPGRGRRGPEELKHFRRRLSREELESFLDGLLERYRLWGEAQLEWIRLRNESIQALPFPYGAYRAGQREMAAAVYRTIAASGRLFTQAPTGIGKTISALFPAVKSMGEQLSDRLFYLTAKTITRQAAEQAFDGMRGKGLRMRSVTLTAKEKICFLGAERACNPDACPYAKGHYDRVNDALRDLLDSSDAMGREVIEGCARRHTVCPFELALDATLWADGIICDYNYAFDPQVYLRRFFQEVNERYVFLVDEAHNLVDRSREMYSAGVAKSAFRGVLKALPKKDTLRRPLNRVIRALNERAAAMGEETDFYTQEESQTEFNCLLEDFIDDCGPWLELNAGTDGAEEALQLFFDALHYLKIAELYDECFVTTTERKGRDVVVKQLCLDPSHALDGCMKRARATALFSATLTPLDYFASVLGGNDNTRTQALPSPYDRDRLCLLMADRISTRYRDREESVEPIADGIRRTVGSHKGNYIVYFPSYQYMQTVAGRFEEKYPDVDILVQRGGMDEQEREAFLARFDEGNDHTLVGFCVLGGIYAEGIDLKGSRLIGTIVVGVGLPQLSEEQNLLKTYYSRDGRSGYDYAYTFPGMNKVLQAAGRVIRGEEDRGVVVLMDDRFTTAQYRRLYPEHWRDFRVVRSDEALERELKEFWDRQGQADEGLPR
ncbi:MAG: ATP-dependent DNA helicase [Clostridiales bacterium]|nr:ATP-dependent DNA helicase [Clostridiales bacterium]